MNRDETKVLKHEISVRGIKENKIVSQILTTCIFCGQRIESITYNYCPNCGENLNEKPETDTTATWSS